MRVLISMGLAAGLAISLSPAAQANMIQEQIAMMGQAQQGQNMIQTPVPAFNPAYGTLNEVQVSLAGTLFWTSDGTLSNPDNLTVSLGPVSGPNSNAGFGYSFPQRMMSTDAVTLNLSGTLSDAGELASFEGAFGYVELIFTSTDFNDSFMIDPDQGLRGTITYDYTPKATSVPEPLTLSLFGAAVAGAAAAARRRRKASKAA